MTVNHQFNSLLTSIRMAFDMLLSMLLEAGAARTVQLGKEAMFRVMAMMQQLRNPSGFRESSNG